MTRPLLHSRDLPALVAEANLAPSVHNTQPTRWRLEPEGTLLLLEATDRRLAVADPLGRDAMLSHGAALEGMALVLSARGTGFRVEVVDAVEERGLRPLLRLHPEPAGDPDALATAVRRRKTFRGRFLPADSTMNKGIGRLGLACSDLLLVTEPGAISDLARLNDEASLRFFRQDAYRAELLSWMRLSRSHPCWHRDGLNAEALQMAGWEAFGAGIVLDGLFSAIDGVGLARPLIGDAAKTRGSAAIALFHRPIDEQPVATGRRFYRVWLEMERQGLSAAPMAVLADDPEAEGTIRSHFNLPQDRRLITAFRIGKAPEQPTGPRPRLPVAELIVQAEAPATGA